MLKNLLIVLIVAVSTAVGQHQIRNFKLNENQLVDSGSNNYAIADAGLEEKYGWKTVSVNGDKITISSANCQSRDLKGLSGSEKADLDKTRANLENVDGTARGWSQSISSIGGVGNSMSHSSGQSGSFIQQSSSSTSNSQVISNGNEFSISRSGLPDSLARISYNPDKVTTFVYQNGTIQMKPTTCLSSSEQRLIQKIKKEYEESMRKFGQNMQQSMDSLHHGMQSMSQSFGGMYGLQQMNMPNSFNPMGQFQPWQNTIQPNYQNGGFSSSNSIIPARRPYNPYSSGMSFGNSFPFGPANSPFGPGFPFSR